MLSEQEREIEISHHSRAMEHEFSKGNREEALYHWRKMRDLINGRTPDTVAEMVRK